MYIYIYICICIHAEIHTHRVSGGVKTLTAMELIVVQARVLCKDIRSPVVKEPSS